MGAHPCILWLLLLALGATGQICTARIRRPPIGPYTPHTHATSHQKVPRVQEGPDLLSRCQLRWRNATLDHFSWAKPETGRGTFRQRYYVCDEYYKPAPSMTDGSGSGPIFFYVGNEADVTLYLNHTGLMWENAEEFGALIVFAEHRYYGRSKPFAPDKVRKHMGYLTAEQAMADYAELLTDLKAEMGMDEGTAVIGFGGSYGGMLAAWMRMKYPHILDGAIAASAPIWNFFGEDPEYNDNSFALGVTYDASAAGGSAAACIPNVKQTWKSLQRLGRTPEGLAIINNAFQLCPGSRVNNTDDVIALRDWLASAWDYMAMGDFPYPSSYMLNGQGQLPAYPVRVACSHLSRAYLADIDRELLQAMGQAVGTFYNYSGSLTCNDFGGGPNPETDEDGNFWDFQWCTEMLMPASRNGVHDMFWPDAFNITAAVENCRKQWDVEPRKLWATIEWGGRRIESASNIVFSNGLLDPWHGGGVLTSISDSVVAVIIPEGAHHLDLMFSNELDPPSVQEARSIELDHMRRWVQEAQQRRPPASKAAARRAGAQKYRASSQRSVVQ